MKAFIKITLLTLSLILAGCMPDSFTKFKENPPAKSTDGTTGSGGSTGTTTTTTPTYTNPPTDVTLSGELTIPIYVYHAVHPTSTSQPDISDNAGGFPQFEYTPAATNPNLPSEISWSITPTLPSNIELAVEPTTGAAFIQGVPLGFSELTKYTVTATHTPTGTVCATCTQDFYMMFISPVDSFELNQLANQNLIIKVDNSTPFSIGETISNAGGANGVIQFVDSANKELHVVVSANADDPDKVFKVTDDIDDLASFLNAEATITSVTYAFKTAAAATGFPAFPAAGGLIPAAGQLQPVLKSKFALNSAVGFEMDNWLTYSASPAFSGSIQFGDGDASSSGISNNLFTWDGTTFTPQGNGGNGEITGFLTVGNSLEPTTYTLSLRQGPTTTTTTPPSTSWVIRGDGAKIISNTFTMSVLDYQMPKPVNRIFYPMVANDHLVVALDSPAAAANFTVGQTLSNSIGFTGTVEAINDANLVIKITTADKYITLSKGDAVDNQSPFFATEGIVQEITYVVDTTSTLSLTPIVNPLFSRDGEVSGKVTCDGTANLVGVGTKFSSEIIAGNQANIFIGGTKYQVNAIANDLSLTLSAVCPAVTGADYIVSLLDETNELPHISWAISPDPSGLPFTGFSFSGGTFTASVNPTGVIPATDFTVSATDLKGNVVNTNVVIGTNSPPRGLAMTQDVLLHVPSNSSFSVGDYVSNLAGALGIVIDTFTASAGDNYQYIAVKMQNGTFTEYDDIDNSVRYASQKTYILGSGVLPYNVRLDMSAANVAKFSTVTDASNTNDIYDTANSWNDSSSTQKQGIVVYKRDSGTNAIYVRAQQGQFSTADSSLFGNTNPATGLAQGSGAAVTNVVADNVVMTDSDLWTYLGTINPEGLDISSSAGAVGVINLRGSATDSVDDSTDNEFHVSMINETPFANGDTLDLSTPHNTIDDSGAGDAAETSTVIKHEHTFYLYRGQPVTLQFQVEIGDVANAAISFDKPLPQGLTFDSATGIISGTPEDSSNRDKYTMTVSTPFGNATYSFSIKVYDHLTLAVNNGGTTKFDTYQLHRLAKGHSKSPCRVTQEAINSSDMATGNCSLLCGGSPCQSKSSCDDAGGTWKTNPKDIVCALDGGQAELFQKGADLQLQIGDGMCTFVKHTPFSFYSMRVKKTTAGTAGTNPASMYKNLGDVDEALCQDLYEGTPEDGVKLTIPAYSTNAGAAPSWIVDSAVTGPEEYCYGKYDNDPAFATFTNKPNCDEGSVQVIQRDYSAVLFECQDSSGAAIDVASATACVEQVGSCDAGGAACNTGADSTDCTTYAECALSGGGAWTYTGKHNDDEYAGHPDAGTATMTNTTAQTQADAGLTPDGCTASTSATSTLPCGGSAGACMDGPGKEFLSDQDLADRTIESIIPDYPPGKSATIPLVYPAPQDKGYSTNRYISNFTTNNSCADAGNYEYAFDKWEAYVADGNASGDVKGDSPWIGGQGVYTYRCTDGANGTKARIRLVIREWDRSFRVSDSIDQVVPAALMDDSTTDGFGLPYNSIGDWDNKYDMFPPAAAQDEGVWNESTGTASAYPAAPGGCGSAATTHYAFPVGGL